MSILAEQLMIPLPPATRTRLLEMYATFARAARAARTLTWCGAVNRTRASCRHSYYDFDGPVMRELLVRKTRVRRDLVDVAEELRINAHSCRRQFMNLKRISKAVDEVDGAGLVETIQLLFQLPVPLATYAYPQLPRRALPEPTSCRGPKGRPAGGGGGEGGAGLRRYARINFLFSKKIEVYKIRRRLAALTFEVRR